MSSVKHELQRSIYQILKRNRSGSYSTKAARLYILKSFAADLVKLGFKLRDIKGLKKKHIENVITYWQQNKISSSTLKNRTAVLRFLCENLNKSNIIPTNTELKIEPRKYSSSTNRAIYNPDFSKISNDYIMVSLELQRVFGLRREESLKIKPYMADKGDRIDLLASWCKGGRGRSIPILNTEQRFWLDRAKEIAKKFDKSLIPKEKNYIQHREVYDKQVSRGGLKKLHGLRHAYAQRRYKELTGWEAPINGGPKSKQLSKEQKDWDFKARMILTEELGHSREQITVNYLGR